ncbi:PDR/VanB family oxidoreductase [Pseudoalteromonas distincta]|uniref:PDR/VanB family oxidoreductase n=1 Tax=Pseudoalteromonas distincta TaxID=77608 RepID=UPI00352F51F3
MFSVNVRSKKVETPNIVSFELIPINGQALPKFDAGSHIDVVLNDKITRQYSLISHPQSDEFYKIAVLKDANSRGGSIALHSDVQVGDTLSISDPRNLFALNSTHNKALLFAGGIGITPIISMARELDINGVDFELHYHAKSPVEAAFYQELVECSFSEKVFFHFSNQPKKDAKALIGEFKTNTHLYTCGPATYMEYIFDSAKSNHWKDEYLHKENFKAEPKAESSENIPFKLILSRSGLEIDVSAEQTALEAIEEAGIELDVSCEMGICGTCVTSVTCGIPDHRDEFFTVDEKAKNDRFTPCCSRALSDSLTLDL